MRRALALLLVLAAPLAMATAVPCPSRIALLSAEVLQELRTLAGVTPAADPANLRLTFEQAVGLATRFLKNDGDRERFEEEADRAIRRARVRDLSSGQSHVTAGWWRDTVRWRVGDVGSRGRDVLEQMFDAIRIVYELRTPSRATWLDFIPRNRAALNRTLLTNAEQVLLVQYRVYLGFRAWLEERDYVLGLPDEAQPAWRSGVRGLVRRVLWPSNSPRHLLQTVQLDEAMVAEFPPRGGAPIREAIHAAVLRRFGVGPVQHGLTGRLIRTAILATGLAIGWQFAPENPFVTAPVVPPAIVLEETAEAEERLRQAPPRQVEEARQAVQQVLDDRQEPPTALEREILQGIQQQLGTPPPPTPAPRLP